MRKKGFSQNFSAFQHYYFTFLFIAHLGYYQTHLLVIIPPVGAILENSVTKLAQWGSSMVATKMQVAKMGKPSRRESQFKIRNKQSCGFV